MRSGKIALAAVLLLAGAGCATVVDDLNALVTVEGTAGQAAPSRPNPRTLSTGLQQFVYGQAATRAAETRATPTTALPLAVAVAIAPHVAVAGDAAPQPTEDDEPALQAALEQTFLEFPFIEDVEFLAAGSMPSSGALSLSEGIAREHRASMIAFVAIAYGQPATARVELAAFDAPSRALLFQAAGEAAAAGDGEPALQHAAAALAEELRGQLAALYERIRAERQAEIDKMKKPEEDD